MKLLLTNEEVKEAIVEYMAKHSQTPLTINESQIEFNMVYSRQDESQELDGVIIDPSKPSKR